MSDKQSHFIESLTEDLRPGRYWRPSQRAATWSLMALVVNIVVMASVQEFRPNFTEHLLQFWRFSLEILSASALTFFLIYYVFNQLVPGKKLKPLPLYIGGFGLIGFTLTLFYSFFSASPESSHLGARPLCVEEVLVYGLVGAGFFFYFVRKAQFHVARRQYFLLGLAACLIPGTLMQMACAYTPLHGALLHYFPAVLVGGLVSLILPFFKQS